jgi:DNA-binding SARP family transcriptional activator
MKVSTQIKELKKSDKEKLQLCYKIMDYYFVNEDIKKLLSFYNETKDLNSLSNLNKYEKNKPKKTRGKTDDKKNRSKRK